MSTARKQRLAIVGSGIGGLALGVALSKLNMQDLFQIDIYESTSKLTQVGAGITFWPRGWEVMKNMGLEESLVAKLSPDQERPTLDKCRHYFSIRKSNQIEGIPIVDVVRPGGPASFHRADVQSALLEHLPPSIPCHLSHRLSTYRETEEGILLEFTNGQTATCDLLVGADGLNSVVRKVLLAEGKNLSDDEANQNARPLWSGVYAYRYVADAEAIRRDAPDSGALKKTMTYCGKNKLVIAYPIGQGKLVNIVLMIVNPDKEGTYVDSPSVQEASNEDVASMFQDWEEDVRALVKHAVKPSKWAIQYVKPLDSYISDSGRVLLLGDAAHATTPFFANGAGLAIESAYFLANIVAKAAEQSDGATINVAQVSDIFNQIRQPYCNAAAVGSRNLGSQYLFNIEEFSHFQDGVNFPVEILPELANALSEGWDWTTTSAMPDLQRALRMFA